MPMTTSDLTPDEKREAELKDFFDHADYLDSQRSSIGSSRPNAQNFEAHDLETGMYSRRIFMATALDTVNIGLGLGFKEQLQLFFSGIVETILLPISAGFSLIRAAAATIVAYKQKTQNAVIRAAVEIASAIVLGVGAVGLLVGSAAIAAVAPILVVAVYALKFAYHLISSIYYGIKSLGLPEKNQHQLNNKVLCIKKAKAHGLLALSSLVVTAIAVVALFFNKISLGWFGIAAGAAAVGAVGLADYKASSQPPLSAALNSPEMTPPPTPAPLRSRMPHSVSNPSFREFQQAMAVQISHASNRLPHSSSHPTLLDIKPGSYEEIDQMPDLTDGTDPVDFGIDDLIAPSTAEPAPGAVETLPLQFDLNC